MRLFFMDREDAGEGYKEFLFPWGEEPKNGGQWAKAYVVGLDSESDTLIQHQYDDVCCRQAYFKGHLIGLAEWLASHLDILMRDIDLEVETVNKFFMFNGLHWRCVEVVGQGLIKLDNGHYIITEGND